MPKQLLVMTVLFDLLLNSFNPDPLLPGTPVRYSKGRRILTLPQLKPEGLYIWESCLRQRIHPSSLLQFWNPEWNETLYMLSRLLSVNS